jgi:hypothetical protein
MNLENQRNKPVGTARRLCDTVRSVYLQARFARSGLESILDELERQVFQHPDFAHLTAWERGCVMGVREAYRTIAFQDWTIWAFDMGGSMPKLTGELTPEELRLVANESHRGHYYWRDNQGNLTSSVFS